MKKVTGVDLMLLGTVLLWALNITVTRYALTHGFHPLAYSTTRYWAAAAVFVAYTLVREGSLRIPRADWKLIGIAASAVFLNQLVFVGAIHLTNASTVGLLLGTGPFFVGIVATFIGLERPGRGFWLAAAVSFAGVGLIAGGASGGFSSDLLGDLLGVATAATWGVYSIAVAPLMRRHSPFRISAVVLPLGLVPLSLVSIPQLSEQGTSGFGWTMGAAFLYAVIGPLFLTNILWFTAISKVGPSRATLFANLEPFFAVLCAVLLLSEHLTGWEVGGGVAIAVGIGLERLWHREATPVSAGALAEEGLVA